MTECSIQCFFLQSNSLTFSKSQLYDNYCIQNNYYVSGVDVSQIARHVSGSDTLNSDQLIAADVSLDGTVSGFDASLVAQFSVVHEVKLNVDLIKAIPSGSTFVFFFFLCILF